MPVQPMSISYDPIPDVEDVTPVDGTIERKEKRSYKFVAIGLACCLLVALFVLFGYKIKKALDTPLQIYQTCPSKGDAMRLLDTHDVLERGFQVGNLEFGNAQCSSKDEKQKLCIPPTYKTSKIIVDSSTTFQKILGRKCSS